MQIKPVGNKLLVKLNAPKEVKSPNGIARPVNKNKPISCGTVVDVGFGKLLQDGSYAPVKDIVIGDIVVWAEYCDTPLIVNDHVKDRDLAIVCVEDIICTLRDR